MESQVNIKTYLKQIFHILDFNKLYSLLPGISLSYLLRIFMLTLMLVTDTTHSAFISMVLSHSTVGFS